MFFNKKKPQSEINLEAIQDELSSWKERAWQEKKIQNTSK